MYHHRRWGSAGALVDVTGFCNEGSLADAGESVEAGKFADVGTSADAAISGEDACDDVLLASVARMQIPDQSAFQLRQLLPRRESFAIAYYLDGKGANQRATNRGSL